MPSLSESPVIARFFKVMVPGFHTKLRLPPAFCRKLKGEIPEEAFLTSCKGTWRVEIGECSDGKICFLEGWDNFVKNHDLKIGEFVVFEQTGRMHFDATAFDSTTCTKEFPVEVHGEEESSAPNINEHAEIARRGRGRPRKRAAYVDEHASEAKRGRGRPRKRIESLQQKETVQYKTNHDIPFEDEFPMKIKEEKEPYVKYFISIPSKREEDYQIELHPA